MVLVSYNWAPFVRKVDNAIHWINLYPLNSDLSGGQRYPHFEQTNLTQIGQFCWSYWLHEKLDSETISSRK